MSDRMSEFVKLSEDLRGEDIDTGRRLERAGIIALLEEVQSIDEALAILRGEK
jgi:hypothetical protein